jgi:hypothetical protein
MDLSDASEKTPSDARCTGEKKFRTALAKATINKKTRLTSKLALN